MVLQQRENEILILLNMVDKNKNRPTDATNHDTQTDTKSVVYNPTFSHVDSLPNNLNTDITFPEYEKKLTAESENYSKLYQHPTATKEVKKAP